MYEHRESLLAAVAHHCAERADAEDCVHDAFLQVVQRPDVDPDRLGGLLRTVAVRRAVDARRHRVRRGDALRRLGPAWSPAPDEVALDRCEAAHLAAVARGLPSGQRRALAARMAGVEPRETAERFGVPARSVHLALARARSTLRAAVGPALGLLLWLRRRGVAPGARLVPTIGLAAAVGLLVTLHVSESPATAPRGAVMAAPSSASVHVARPPITNAPAAPALVGTRDMSRRPFPAQAPTGAPPQFHAVVGDPVVVSLVVTVRKRRPDQSFLQSVEACLAPGGLSVDPHHAGCTAAY
ncbi:MAG: hypothetical protein NVSMB29_19680 [Candidatus Dormibacteria bacterium]